MKTKLLIALLLTALTSQASPTITTSNITGADSIRLFEQDEPDGTGYKLTKTVTLQWPTEVNGKYSSKLAEFLAEEVFSASKNRDIIPYIPADTAILKDFLSDWVYRDINSNSMTAEFVKKSFLSAPDISAEEYPLSCWYEKTNVRFDHCVNNLAFFASEYEDYHGGTHGMFFTRYLPFDVRLDKPIHIGDIVTKPSAVIRMLPKFDNRPEENKHWQNVTTIDNFYIENGNIIFVFAPYEVGPYCDGEVEVSVPLSKLQQRGLLTAYGKLFVKGHSINPLKRSSRK